MHGEKQEETHVAQREPVATGASPPVKERKGEKQMQELPSVSSPLPPFPLTPKDDLLFLLSLGYCTNHTTAKLQFQNQIFKTFLQICQIIKSTDSSSIFQVMNKIAMSQPTI